MLILKLLVHQLIDVTLIVGFSQKIKKVFWSRLRLKKRGDYTVDFRSKIYTLHFTNSTLQWTDFLFWIICLYEYIRYLNDLLSTETKMSYRS